MPNHLLRYCHVVVYLSVVYLKLQSDEVWQDSSAARLGLDGYLPLAC